MTDDDLRRKWCFTLAELRPDGSMATYAWALPEKAALAGIQAMTDSFGEPRVVLHESVARITEAITAIGGFVDLG